MNVFLLIEKIRQQFLFSYHMRNDIELSTFALTITGKFTAA